MTDVPDPSTASRSGEGGDAYGAYLDRLANEWAAGIRQGQLDFQDFWKRFALDVRNSPYVRDAELRSVTLSVSPNKKFIVEDFIFEDQDAYGIFDGEDWVAVDPTPENAAYVAVFYDLSGRIEELLGCDADTYISDRLENRR